MRIYVSYIRIYRIKVLWKITASGRMFLGKKIRFTSGTDWEYGTAVAIDEDGGLIVEKEDHTQEILHTGEITVRVC